MTVLDDFRMTIRGRAYVPIVIGGMGVAISTRELALEAARLGGIGHISDAMLPAVLDRETGSKYVRAKLQRYKHNVGNRDKREVQFDLDELAEATRRHVSSLLEAKRGPGGVFLNCMERLTMNNPAGTLRARLSAALDAGVDGITLSAGLHLASFSLIQEHPRFHDAALGIIVSSVRALDLFLRKASRTRRLPDYVVIEGPLAGGHLGFGDDWARHDLASLAADILRYLDQAGLDIPVIAAGGVFSGSDGVALVRAGCAGVQVATRFTITEECGLPFEVKQAYIRAEPEDIVVNHISPTGYPMRMLRQSPAIGSSVRPNCEAYGYLLKRDGGCAYLAAYEQALATANSDRVRVQDKTCLCTQMRRFKVWTCGHYAHRLKETARLRPDGLYDLPSARHVFRDYQFGKDHAVSAAPPRRGAAPR